MEKRPTNLPILPLKNTVVYPEIIVPLASDLAAFDQLRLQLARVTGTYRPIASRAPGKP